jgi:acyl transferase domain-containing protein/NADPH:quinone reductase-like Zn-dependent oxidoreductase/acyl carrier protein
MLSKPLSDDPARSSPIAVVGMAFRFPGDLGDEAAFWNALKEGKNLVGEIPADRWATRELSHGKPSEPGRSVTFSAGVLSRIDEFDAGFFGISPREAACLDPQQRLLLELAWEAMENAGLPPSSLAGSDCAVYIGISSLDYGMRVLDDLASMTAHSMTGNTMSIAANRLSYVFDLRGPSLAVDSACSSSLAALHQACDSLRGGEASTALVGGVNLLLHPYSFVGFSKASMLSAEGRCKVFDAAGTGYARAEGGAVLLLKPLQKALADGDDILALILASGVNADGARKTGITVPSREGQVELMRAVLAKSGLAAHEIDFIEAHGTGTAVGDPVEAAAIGAVYGSGRAAPLPIGSVKANLGHLESASGMAGLVKAVLALKNRALPPLVRPHAPHPCIDFSGLNLELVPEYRELSGEKGRPLVAGVNSFGFGGANTHVLLQEFCPVAAPARAPKDLAPPPLFLSARGEAALRAMAGRYADVLRAAPDSEYYDIARAAAQGRERLEKRLALHCDAPEQAPDILQRYAEGGSPERILVEDALPQGGGIAFVYSGNGAQWAGMGRALLAESSRFAQIFAELDAAMRPLAGFSLSEELQATQENSRLDDTRIAQPMLFAIQVAVTMLLKDFGVEPAAVAGHSVGEVAAAWASGAFDLEQAIRVICVRSQAQGKTRGTGRMAAIGLSAEAAREAMAELSGELSVELACLNSPDNVTLSGDLEGLLRLQARLEPQGVFFRLLDLDYAFHSQRMDCLREDLAEGLAGLAPSPCEHAAFVSTVTGDALPGEALDAAYWWRNVREPVRFSEAMERLSGLGCRVFVEIGPRVVLRRYIDECLAAANVKGRVLSTLRKEESGARQVSEAALRAQLLADTPGLQAYFPFPARRVRLPNYPWQRERHWHARTSEALLSTERRREHPLLGWRLSGTAWENILDPVTLPWLADHKVGGAIVHPGAAYAEMALAAAAAVGKGGHFALEQLDIAAPMVFDGKHARTLHLVFDPRDNGFLIESRQRLSHDEWTRHASGRLLESAARTHAPRLEPPGASARRIDAEAHYRAASALGLDYGPAFRGLREARIGKERLEACLEIPESLDLDGYLLHPALLDLCFQSLIDFLGEESGAAGRGVLLPVKIGRFELCGGPGPVRPARLRACLRRRGARSALADFELLDEQGELVARLAACRFRVAPLKRHEQNKISNWRILPGLKPHPAEGLRTVTPAPSDLAARAKTRLAGLGDERNIWFKETLPLIEALTLSLAREACRQLARQRPQDWRDCLDTTPHGRWLASLLGGEGLLRETAGQWTLVDDDALLSPEALWQTLLREAPACLPQLMRIGRVGRQWPALLLGEADGREWLGELRKSPLAERLHDDDPVCLGLRLVLEDFLRYLADGWPASRRLRVLEIASGPGRLPETLIDALPEDCFDYVLALPDEAMQARQQAEYRDHASVVVAAFDARDWTLSAGQRLPEAFDVVILRHTLHRADDPRAALAQTRRRLAAGALLLVAERHPDWSANFVEGIDPSWWRGTREGDCPLSSLLPPEAWKQALIDEGFADCEAFFEPAAEGLSEGAYLLLARRPGESPVSLPAPEAASWRLLADAASRSLAQELRDRLESLGQCVVVSERFEPSGACDHLVYLLGWNDTANTATRATTRLLEEVQMLAARPGNNARLWIVTRGGSLAGGSPGLDLHPDPNPAQAALWGFGRVVMNEYPRLSGTLIDLACDPEAPDTLARLENELLWPDGADEIVLSAGARYSLALREETEGRTRKEAANARFRLDFHIPGQLHKLLWQPDAERPLRDNEIEARARAAGLNFRDLMYLMGLLPDEAIENGFAGASLGLEFSGVVTRVGAGVRNLKPGDAVMGFGAACFASHVITREDAVARMPEGWRFEAAATVPTVFFTVHYALTHLSALRPGERVLIHGAAGGIGMAAISLARHLGAEIYATAGSAEKRDFARLLGADHVFDSRSLAFADEILDATGGEGVDVVLNSLAGEAMRRGLDVLRPFGRFVELGKRDFFENTPVGLRPFRNNISYFGVDADSLLIARPDLAARLFGEVMALFHEGALSPLPYRTFSASRIVEAFRTMQQARHIGKIVVSLEDARPALEQPEHRPAPIRLAKDATWLVTGGLSGFGLESARWLASRGAGYLVLASRRGMDAPGAEDILESFAAQGVEVLVQACDITCAEAVAALVERIEKTLPPLKGILHAAALFDDRPISRLDAPSLESVLDTKLLGAWHLHEATLGLPLEHFVLYSSITTAIGNPGQANYVAANAALESLAALRRRMGLPASAVAWGPIADAGYLVRHEAVRESLEQRLGKPALAASGALAQLDRALAGEDAPFISMPANLDWNVLARLLPSSGGSRFERLNRHRAEQARADDSVDVRALIAGKTPEEGQALVRELVAREIGQILRISPERIESGRSLHDQGMDSLMAVELALGLEQRFGIQLPVMMLGDSPTVDTVCVRIVEKLNGNGHGDGAKEDASAALVAGLVRQHGEGVSAEEVAEMAEAVREQNPGWHVSD